MTGSVEWLTKLFGDLEGNSPPGIFWTVDRGDVPLKVQLSVGVDPLAEVLLAGDSPEERIAFVQKVQALLQSTAGGVVPRCPTHGVMLQLCRREDDVEWCCPDGDDVHCAVGELVDLVWPPATTGGDLPPLLGTRWRRRGVEGVLSWGVTNGVVQARVREGADEAAIREAVAPFEVEIEWRPPPGWRRLNVPQGEMLVRTNSIMHLVGCSGVLRRSDDGDLSVGETKVRLTVEHRLGGPGEVLLMDPDGVAFADEGDEVTCGGSFERPAAPIRQLNTDEVFIAGLITRVRPPQRP